MTTPEPGQAYFIINKESGLATDLSPEDSGHKRFVVGLPFTGKESQRWRIEQIDLEWTIQNLANGQFYTIDIPENVPDAIKAGVRVITAEQRRLWAIKYDEHFRGSRILIPHTPLNTGLPNGERPGAGIPITLQLELPAPNQIWDFKRVLE